MKKLNKSANFTDIHWGAKSNSELHNQDNLRYIDWFCTNVKNDPTIDHIKFLGDWFENRSAINVSTLQYAAEGFRKLRDLKLPIFFVVGNHDLYMRHTRKVYSPIIYSEYDNVNIIDEPSILPNIGSGILLSPYLFHEEYTNLIPHLQLETWWGHFEFKGFYITGYNIKMEAGPDPDNYKGPKHIVSGHFHKRQANKNVVYMGNVFPTSFNDAGDNDRGMMTYDHNTDDMQFINWVECPKYVKTTLSKLLDDDTTLLPNEARVKVEIDIPISFEESNLLRKTFIQKHNLREFTMEESAVVQQAISETNADIDWNDHQLTSVDDLVQVMLKEIDSDHINNDTLIKIYTDLKTSTQ